MDAVNVCAYSDEPLLLRALDSLLTDTQEMQLVSAFSSLPAFFVDIAVSQPQIVLFDSDGVGNLTTVRELRGRAPKTAIVLLAREIAVEVAWQAINVGIQGIIPKTATPETLLECLRRVASGEMWFPPALTARLLKARSIRLTPRESQLIAALARGLKNKEIAGELNICEGTVKVYLSKLFEKVGAKDRFELALFGLRNAGGYPVSAGRIPGSTYPGVQLQSIITRRSV